MCIVTVNQSIKTMERFYNEIRAMVWYHLEDDSLNILHLQLFAETCIIPFAKRLNQHIPFNQDNYLDWVMDKFDSNKYCDLSYDETLIEVLHDLDELYLQLKAVLLTHLS